MKETISRVKALTLHELIEALTSIQELHGENEVMHVNHENGNPVTVSVVSETLTDQSVVFDIVLESIDDRPARAATVPGDIPRTAEQWKAAGERMAAVLGIEPNVSRSPGEPRFYLMSGDKTFEGLSRTIHRVITDPDFTGS